MARETRSATGNSKPRVVPVIDTAPTIKRKAAPKKAAPKAEAKGAKPTGVTKKKAPKKETGVAKKVATSLHTAVTTPRRQHHAMPGCNAATHENLPLTRPSIGQGCREEDGQEGGHCREEG